MKLSQKLGYGVGQLSDGAKQAAFSTFLFFYYNQVLGLSGSLAGAAALLALLADAITDPMIGQISDRFRSRFGRRHPFMLAGVVPFAIAMVALFSPPSDLSQYELFGWMLGCAVAVRFALTLFFVPHLSLGAELVKDYHERTSLIGYRVFFTYAGILVVSVVGFAVFFPSTPDYPNGLLNAASYPGFGMFCGVLGAAAMFITVFSTRFAIPNLTQPAQNIEKKNPLLAVKEVFRTLKIASFRNLFTVTLMFTSLVGMVGTLTVYVATYVFEFTPGHLAGLASSFVVGLLFASLVAQKLSRRFDKRFALGVCVTLGSLTAFAPIIGYLLGLFEGVAIAPKFSFVFIMTGLSQIFFIAYTILLDSMLTDVIDENEMYTGVREEGLFFAARSFATKASFGIGSFVAGISLDIIEFPKNATVETINPEVVSSLAMLGGPIMLLLFISTVFISRRYPLDQKRHSEILAAIKAGGVEPVVSEQASDASRQPA